MEREALVIHGDTLEQIERLHVLAHESAGNAVGYAIECGRLLLQQKALLKHGQFGEWCKSLSFSYATAAAYMRATVNAPKIERAQHLSIRALLKLSSKEAKREVVTSIAEAATIKTADLSALSERGMKFGTILADPPWLYGNQSTRGATSDHYGGMTVEEIAALPIANLAADNAHLHLWTTNAFLFESKQIIEAWGFEYRSCFVWVKPQIGMGNYWRVSHEFLLFGVRGSCPFRDHSLRSWAELARGKHSSKPDQIRTLIEKAGHGPRLELFARRPAPGWVVWGNEVERTVFDNSVEEWAAAA